MSDISIKWTWNAENQNLVLVFYFQCARETEPTSNIRVEKKPRSFSWAPTHIEHGLIGCLLNLANIANGYKPDKRSRLAKKLRPRRHTLNETTVRRFSKMIKEAS